MCPGTHGMEQHRGQLALVGRDSKGERVLAVVAFAVGLPLPPPTTTSVSRVLSPMLDGACVCVCFG